MGKRSKKKTMKHRKAFITPILCLLSALLLLLLLLVHGKQNDLYHDNASIANTADRYSVQNFIVTEIGDGQWKFSIGSLSGIKNTASFSLEHDSQISLNASCDVSNGTFKLVLVDVENREVLAILCDNSNGNSGNTFELPQGSYAIKAVGKKAAVTGDFTIAISKA